MKYNYRDKTALITGASSGIGEAFATRLAEECGRIILVARSAQQLGAVAQRLNQKSRATVHLLAADLTAPDAAQHLLDECTQRGWHVDVVVNNAGLGTFGLFHELSLEAEGGMVLLNAKAACDIAHAFLPGMVRRGDGVLINTASSAALLPTPWFATYGATKAFVLSLSESLWALYRRRGVRVCAVCPGPVDTGFFAKTDSDIDTVGVFKRRIPVQRVVERTLWGVDRNQPVVLCDAFTALQSFMTRLAPRSVVARISEVFMRPRPAARVV